MTVILGLAAWNASTIACWFLISCGIAPDRVRDRRLRAGVAGVATGRPNRRRARRPRTRRRARGGRRRAATSLRSRRRPPPAASRPRPPAATAPSATGRSGPGTGGPSPSVRASSFSRRRRRRAMPGSHSASASIISSVRRQASSSVRWRLDDRVRHHRVADRVAVVVERGADRERLHVDGAADVRRQLRRQRAHRDRVDAEARRRGPGPRRRRRRRGSGSARRRSWRWRRSGPARRSSSLDDRGGVLAAPLDLERLAGVEHPLRSRRTHRGCGRPRSRYSPIGTWNRSTASPAASRLPMNHGLYSAWCSDDSVG